jgi:predicted ATPase
LIKEPIPPTLSEATSMFRYNPTVFIAPPWEAIYQHDSERKQDFEEAVQTYQALQRGYLENNYQLQVLPEATVEERVAFVLNTITNPIS